MSLRAAITEDRVEEALRYLAETDEECARLRAETGRTEFKAKALKAALFTRGVGTVADRQAAAEMSEEYGQAMGVHFDALAAHEAMRNKRSTETLAVEVWRSLNAARRQGNVP